MKKKIGKKRFFQALTLLVIILTASFAQAMKFKAGDMGEFEITGAIKASFGATQYLDFVDDYDTGDDADFDATRELGLRTKWIINERLKGVASFQIGEGSTGGYFGSTDAVVGGEEDGDLIFELDELYIDYTTVSGMHFKIGSQFYNFHEIGYGSLLMYEVPAGVVFSAPIGESAGIEAAWFRMADLYDDTESNTDDQADLLLIKAPLGMAGFKLTPWAAYAYIQEDVIANAASHWTYAYFDYPALLAGTNGLANTTPTDGVTAYYLGMKAEFSPIDPMNVAASATYGNMEWETTGEDITVSGFFTDLVVTYKAGWCTPELFAFYGNGPDANDNDIDMMPVLISAPLYTTSFFGGSRFNDNMFDSHDTTYAVSMWAVGFKLKDIKTSEKLSHEFQIMYAQGTADDSIFQSPDDTLMNEDESLIEINFNSEYQVMKNLVFATELGYIMFDEDGDYNESANGSVEDFWKVAFSIELTF